MKQALPARSASPALSTPRLAPRHVGAHVSNLVASVDCDWTIGTGPLLHFLVRAHSWGTKTKIMFGLLILRAVELAASRRAFDDIILVLVVVAVLALRDDARQCKLNVHPVDKQSHVLVDFLEDIQVCLYPGAPGLDGF